MSSVQSLSHVQLFLTPWTAACKPSLSITNSQSLLKPMSIKSVMPSNHLSSVIPFPSRLQSFTASGSFPVSQFFASSGQSIGASASPPCPSNISVQFNSSVMSDRLQLHGLQHARPPCPSATPGVHPDSRPLSQCCHPSISFSVITFSCPQSLPASESFPMSQLFT